MLSGDGPQRPQAITARSLLFVAPTVGELQGRFVVHTLSCYHEEMDASDPRGNAAPVLRVIRSARRRSTISARLAENGSVLEVLAPAGISESELAPAIEKLKARLLRRAEKHETANDRELARRAAELNCQYFGGKLHWREIRYVTNQQRRFGSCTPATGAIRISHRVATLPGWVRDYVIVHELAHLAEPNHGRRFWQAVERYPKTERARGYLMALGLEWEGDDPAEQDLE
jgi:predicted metal-dependent hydrolase